MPMIVGCDKKTKDDEITIEFDTDALTFAFDEKNTDKTIVVTTNYTEVLDIEIAYTDPDRTGWIDAIVEGNNINVAVTSDNRDAQERPRTAIVTVKAGNATKDFAVTQEAYVETDGAMTFPAAGLEFAASGNELTKTITSADAKVDITAVNVVDAAGADLDKPEWITLAFEGKTVTVTVTPNEDYTNSRTAIVKATNRLDGSATFNVTQEKRPPLDLSGTWSWTSKNFTMNNTDAAATGEADADNPNAIYQISVPNAKNASGTATIAAIAGGYKITGIKGVGTADLKAFLDANTDAVPTFRIKQDETDSTVFTFGVLDTPFNFGTPKAPNNKDIDSWFNTSNYYYASSVMLANADDETAGTYALDATLPISYEVKNVDGVQTEVLTFATTKTAEDSTLQKVTYTYMHFYQNKTAYHDMHRNLVLTRPLGE